MLALVAQVAAHADPHDAAEHQHQRGQHQHVQPRQRQVEHERHERERQHPAERAGDEPPERVPARVQVLRPVGTEPVEDEQPQRQHRERDRQLVREPRHHAELADRLPEDVGSRRRPGDHEDVRAGRADGRAGVASPAGVGMTGAARRARRPGGLELLGLRLGQQPDDARRPLHHVAARQSLRLAHEPVEPLEAEVAPGLRGTLGRAGEEVGGRAERDGGLRAGRQPVQPQPVLLAGLAEARRRAGRPRRRGSRQRAPRTRPGRRSTSRDGDQ